MTSSRPSSRNHAAIEPTERIQQMVSLTPIRLLTMAAVIWLAFGVTFRAGAIDITKSADDHFHHGAMAYLTNNIPAALDVVSNGLVQFPTDEKLKKLEELLKKQQQQQNQQNQQDQNKDQEQKDQQDKQDQKQDQQKQQSKDQQSKQDQQKQDKQQQEQAKKDVQKKDQQKQDADQKSQQNQPQQQQAATAAGQMTPEQAQRVLDMQKNDEKMLPVQMLMPQQQPDKKLKDW